MQIYAGGGFGYKGEELGTWKMRKEDEVLQFKAHGFNISYSVR